MDPNSFVDSRLISSENRFNRSVVRNSLASLAQALESLPAWAGVFGTNLSDARVVGFERRRRSSLPRVYEYVRVDVSPSSRPGRPTQTSDLAFVAHNPGSAR